MIYHPPITKTMSHTPTTTHPSFVTSTSKPVKDPQPRRCVYVTFRWAGDESENGFIASLNNYIANDQNDIQLHMEVERKAFANGSLRLRFLDAP